MDNQLKWGIEDVIKDAFKDEIQKNTPREKIKIKLDLQLPEVSATIDYLSENGYIEFVKGDISLITISQDYYNYLKEEIRGKDNEVN